jgi:hypothetical protein
MTVTRIEQSRISILHRIYEKGKNYHNTITLIQPNQKKSSLNSLSIVLTHNSKSSLCLP